MFQQLRNIDSAFKHVRFFSIVIILANCSICYYVIYKNNEAQKNIANKIYVIANDKLMDAVAVDRKEKLVAEIKDHVKMFHYYFYTLEPDDKLIKSNITKAFYLADQSAKAAYDDLKENAYYNNIISANISQHVEDPDSIIVNISDAPYSFKYFSKLKIIRATSIVTRSLITEGTLRITKPSDNNNHGFLKIGRAHV